MGQAACLVLVNAFQEMDLGCHELGQCLVVVQDGLVSSFEGQDTGAKWQGKAVGLVSLGPGLGGHGGPVPRVALELLWVLCDLARLHSMVGWQC